jgi:radical SAM protein with 4Fe4S-binding SPASM domain
VRFISFKSFFNKTLNSVEIKLCRDRFASDPVEILLEPTKACNSKCIMCLQRLTRDDLGSTRECLSWETFNKVRPFFAKAESVLFSGFGEPLMHPDFLEMVYEIKKAGPYVYIFSNGISLTPELSKQIVSSGLLDELSVSIGGATEATHKKIRGTSLKVTLDNLRVLAGLKREMNKKKPVISFNIVAMNSTIRELQDIIDIASSLGVARIQMPHLSAHSEELKIESPWTQKELATKLFKEAHQKAEEKGIVLLTPLLFDYFRGCDKWMKSVAVTWDGFVANCAQERHILGNLREQSLRDIWNGDKMRYMRKLYYKEGIQSLCPDCRDWKHSADSYLNPKTIS